MDNFPTNLGTLKHLQSQSTSTNVQLGLYSQLPWPQWVTIQLQQHMMIFHKNPSHSETSRSYCLHFCNLFQPHDFCYHLWQTLLSMAFHASSAFSKRTCNGFGTSKAFQEGVALGVYLGTPLQCYAFSMCFQFLKYLEIPSCEFILMRIFLEIHSITSSWSWDPTPQQKYVLKFDSFFFLGPSRPVFRVDWFSRCLGATFVAPSSWLDPQVFVNVGVGETMSAVQILLKIMFSLANSLEATIISHLFPKKIRPFSSAWGKQSPAAALAANKLQWAPTTIESRNFKTGPNYL